MSAARRPAGRCVGPAWPGDVGLASGAAARPEDVRPPEWGWGRPQLASRAAWGVPRAAGWGSGGRSPAGGPWPVAPTPGHGSPHADTSDRTYQRRRQRWGGAGHGRDCRRSRRRHARDRGLRDRGDGRRKCRGGLNSGDRGRGDGRHGRNDLRRRGRRRRCDCGDRVRDGSDRARRRNGRHRVRDCHHRRCRRNSRERVRDRGHRPRRGPGRHGVRHAAQRTRRGRLRRLGRRGASARDRSDRARHGSRGAAGEQVSLRRPNSDRQGQRTRKHPHARHTTGAARSEFRAGHGHSKSAVPTHTRSQTASGQHSNAPSARLSPSRATQADQNQPGPPARDQQQPKPLRTARRLARDQQQRTLGHTRTPADPSPHQGPNQAPPPRSPAASLRVYQ